jgi:hypothetical protein
MEKNVDRKVWLVFKYCLRIYLEGLGKTMKNVKTAGLWVQKKKC